MEKTNTNPFEILKSLEKRIKGFESILEEMKEKPNLCFAKSPLREGSYWDVIDGGEKKKGMITIMDLPTDLHLKEAVVILLIAEKNRLQEEFDSYTINK